VAVFGVSVRGGRIADIEILSDPDTLAVLAEEPLALTRRVWRCTGALER
jgi:hypothetical protein